MFVNHCSRDARDATSINAILKTKPVTITTVPISSTKHSKRKFGDTIDKNVTTIRKSVTEIISFFKKSVIFFISDNVAGICYEVLASR
jgi:isopropylmalate/homocitrate/citramalate synthase